MTKKIRHSCFFALALLLSACGLKVSYNFSGASTGTATSFQVNFFQNYADQSPGSTIEPGLDRDFTFATGFDFGPDFIRFDQHQWRFDL